MHKKMCEIHFEHYRLEFNLTAWSATKDYWFKVLKSCRQKTLVNARMSFHINVHFTCWLYQTHKFTVT